MFRQILHICTLVVLVSHPFRLAAQNPRSTEPSTPVNSPVNSVAAPDSAFQRNGILSGLVNLEFSNYHLTPRGLNLQNQGLIFQPKILLFWKLYGAREASSFLDEVTLTTGYWNDFDTVQSGKNPGNWYETDPSAGFNVKFLKDWTLESPFTAFISETDSFSDCWNWNPRLTYHDHLFPSFSFNPYAEFFYEITNKSTVVFDPATSERGYYGVLGAIPAYVFQKLPLKVEFPTYLLLPSKSFYQRHDGSGGGTAPGLFSTMVKVTWTLDRIPKSYGTWSLYAGVQYDYLNNPGLLDGNQFDGAAHSRERSLWQLHSGVTVHF